MKSARRSSRTSVNRVHADMQHRIRELQELQLLRFFRSISAADRPPPPSAKPRILLLQGPVGPFFRELHQSLTDLDFDVVKFNFNGGDLWFSVRTDCLNFKGTPAEWRTWLDTFVAGAPPAAIILFGDNRPYHFEALAVAADRGIAIWCLEEGYVRPDYITCERDGNNARSPLRLSPAAPEPRRPVTPVPIGNSFFTMAAYGALYAIAQACLAWRFNGNVRHRQRRIFAECFRWTLSLARKLAFYPANRRIMNSIKQEHLRDFYVVALQVHDDLNLRCNGNGWTMERLIDEATLSFTLNAPADSQLVFKAHPLDRGHRPYRKLVARAARAHRCVSRVRVVDDGPIGQIIRHCDGVITVNSTSGLIALEQGKPLLALGNAVYSSIGLQAAPLTGSDRLDRFWRKPTAARSDEVRGFLERMQHESLVNGSFYLPLFRSNTADAVAERIQSGLLSDDLTRLLTMIGKGGHQQNGSDHERLAG